MLELKAHEKFVQIFFKGTALNLLSKRGVLTTPTGVKPETWTDTMEGARENSFTKPISSMAAKIGNFQSGDSLKTQSG